MRNRGSRRDLTAAKIARRLRIINREWLNYGEYPYFLWAMVHHDVPELLDQPGRMRKWNLTLEFKYKRDMKRLTERTQYVRSYLVDPEELDLLTPHMQNKIRLRQQTLDPWDFD